MSLLATLNWSQWFMAVLIIGTCLLLILVILLQKGRGQGLTGAFGGGGGGGAFGAKTGDVFTWITVIFAGIFLMMAVVANFAFDDTPKPFAPITIGEGTIPSDGATETTLPFKIEGKVFEDFDSGDFENVEDTDVTEEPLDTQDDPETENPPDNNNEGTQSP